LHEVKLAQGAKLVVKENVLAVFCDHPLKTVSSAFYCGGHQCVHAILNVGVPEGYNDVFLHQDPLELIRSSAAKVGVTKEYLAMVTAAKIQNFSLVEEKLEDFSVSVAVTAGCKHGESAGEQINAQEMCGTINIIVFIDAYPSDSCMVAALITATEAKSAALRDLDVRSLYSGDSATGSITDSVTVASTEVGKVIALAGPASKLGKIIGRCTRRAVAEALLKQEPFWNNRTVEDRLKERHLEFEKLVTEISKVEGVLMSAESLRNSIKKMPGAGVLLLAAAKLDDDYKKNLLPADFADWKELTSEFGAFHDAGLPLAEESNLEQVDLPPFVKHALIKIIQENSRRWLSEKT
jgi:adenosylcobinamide hydrolase